MKTALNASNWNGMMAALYAFASPGAGAFLAIVPTLGLLAGWLTQTRRLGH